MTSFDFEIHASGKISGLFLFRNLATFQKAAHFIKHLPYGRNKNKEDVARLLSDGYGTCSTKHALLKQLADENGFTEVRLILGMFKMNAGNTPAIAETLSKHGLQYMPEAHCYLKVGAAYMDCTKKTSDPEDFLNDLLEEREISPGQISSFKIDYHKKFLERWVRHHREIDMTVDELWQIREQCIKDLEDKKA